ncbi:hypothetical protein KI387_038589, partial [Taxus chinensis]
MEEEDEGCGPKIEGDDVVSEELLSGIVRSTFGRGCERERLGNGGLGLVYECGLLEGMTRISTGGTGDIEVDICGDCAD